ncbi:sulfotransferase [Romeria aff. gracilis LEGE 07310]|uniref:Sulfotransferase n=1 Tax=Vasconcelosia minhoensis LEGE 07310 TaxID=915328 RepID=A0A8J7AJR9_9CYAN|nr:sulfotransferase [Romeria gracilis]MBE9078883.1 sulfotransferase [Romeria aff. gracilis LEGE 07310]
MPLPNFLIIGVQKAGSTSVYEYLKQHPQVYVSPRKETEFFSRDLSQIPEKKTTPGGRRRILTLEDYQSLFANVTDELAIGEASPNYMMAYRKAIPNIQKYVPDARLIAILRNPVERAYSDYLMHVRDAIGSPKSLGEQVKTKAESSHMLLKGRYYEQLSHYVDAFGWPQIKVFLYDDLRRDSTQMMREIYQFIGVERDFTADTQKRFQTAEVPKNQAVNRLLRTKNPIRSAVAGALRQVLPESVRQQLRLRLIAANSQDKSSQSLPEEDRQLLFDYYREDMLKLQDLIGRDLSNWLSDPAKR